MEGPVERARSQHCANQSAWANLGLMGAVFTHAPIELQAIAVQVGKIYFVAPCRYCRDGRRATTNIRPVDAIGRPMGDLNILRRSCREADRAGARAAGSGSRDTWLREYTP